MPMLAERDSAQVVRSNLRVLVCSGVRLLREVLVGALESRGVPNVVGIAAPDLTGVLESMPPDVVIVDVRCHGMLDILRALAAGPPPVPAIAFGVEEREADVLACAEAGASAFLSAECGPDDVRAAIDSVRADELVCSPRVAALLFRWHRFRAAATPTHIVGVDDGLTNREREVLTLLDRGMSNKEIAAALFISLATVKQHVHRILEKLHVRGRWAAVAQAREANRTPARRE